ncbi:MAG: YibE/F family protein [Acidobacteria bacterium]|nr:YibE/F family protein [Acidobacteriota bacterium]
MTSHERDFDRFLEPEARTLLRVVPYALVGLGALLTLIGAIVLWPTGEARPDLAEIGINPVTIAATVVDTNEVKCGGLGLDSSLRCVDVTFEMAQGPDAGSTTIQQFVVTDSNPVFAVGDDVILDYQPASPEGFQYSFLDRQRRPVLFFVGLLFAVIVVALGRLRGVAALAGLAASVAVLLKFVVPAIIDGRSPVLVAVIGASLIAYLALYVAHGFTRMTTVALLGTLAALGLTAILSWLVVGAARFSGFATEEAFILSFAGRIDIAGLVLAGIVLGAVGAIDDVTVTQASAVFEVHRVRPDLGRRELFASGLRIGRDHVASTVNTLLLAYAGAAMPLLLFLVLADQSIGTALNSELVAIEVIRTLVGSIGLVSAVPLTTWLAAVMAADDHTEDDHHHVPG